MLRQELIGTVIDAQKKSFLSKDISLLRDTLDKVPIVENFATIITGLRRCGKSTLLLQVLQKNYSDALYLNFEDIRLTGFDATDFIRLLREIERRKLKVLFFDEIQLVEKWEIFVHQLLNEGYAVFISGSNASLLSKEMGTHLTGRHLSMELFPFSYAEFLSFKDLQASAETLTQYMVTGGLPEYLKHQQAQIMTILAEDIVVRDIAIRHGVREVDALKQLLVYLISNVGAPLSANKLSGLFGLKSSTTILEYFGYYRDAYLLDFVPQFSYSLKSQARNPKKVYAIDTGFIHTISHSFTENRGRILENLIYLHLRRSQKDIYYFKGVGECDFVMASKGSPAQVIQVCHEVNDENFDREWNGLVEAMQFFKLKEGWLITMNQSDHFEKDGFTVKMLPAHEFVII